MIFWYDVFSLMARWNEINNRGGKTDHWLMKYIFLSKKKIEQ